MNKKNIKVRTCILCFNKFNQNQLIRLFTTKNYSLIIITFNNKITLINNSNYGLPNLKELIKNKNRSIYFCLECIKKNDIDKTHKKINNYFSKLIKLKKLRNLEKLKNYLTDKKNLKNLLQILHLNFINL